MIDPQIRNLPFEEYLETVRRFTDEELIPAETEMTAQGAVPERLVERMAEIGLFGITLPKQWGGLGWSMVEQARLTFEFTRASCVYRSRFSTTIGLSSQIILDHGTDEQRQRYLEAMANGQCVTAFALTEEHAGSDAGAVRTTAVKEGDEFVVNGSKRYITNAAWADMLIVFARTNPDVQGGRGTSAILVDPASPGVTTALPSQMNGHEAGPVAEIHFDNVRVPRENLIGDAEGTGLRLALRGINHARTHVAATAVGQATRLLDEATRHARKREQFGQPLADFGAIESLLGASYAELEAARALVLSCAAEFDEAMRAQLAGDASPVIPAARIAAAKLFATEMASRVADRAVQILGGEGIVGDHPVPRMWRDVRALRIYEGASQVHERNLARHLMKTVGQGASGP